MDEIERMKKVEDWYNLVQKIEVEAKPLITKEMALRREIIDLFFPTKVEGTMQVPLYNGGGWALKTTYKLDRKIDPAALPAVLETLREQQVPGLDGLIVNKPNLVLKEYKMLAKINKEAAKIFDQALIIKPGSPDLSLVPPPKPKGESDAPA